MTEMIVDFLVVALLGLVFGMIWEALHGGK